MIRSVTTIWGSKSSMSPRASVPFSALAITHSAFFSFPSSLPTNRRSTGESSTTRTIGICHPVSSLLSRGGSRRNGRSLLPGWTRMNQPGKYQLDAFEFLFQDRVGLLAAGQFTLAAHDFQLLRGCEGSVGPKLS